MRSIFPGIIGNDSIKDNLGRRIAAGENTHAYIIEGDVGSGKKTMATLASAAASCEHRYDEEYSLPCGECAVCRRIISGISPDTVVISSGERASIGVDDIRAIRSGLYTVPNDSDVRTYIIENAEKMTTAAQNALLLTLEEPPSYAVFLLLTEDSSGLLETVRSRCVHLRTERHSREKIEEYLKQMYPRRDHDEISSAAQSADGSVGRAILTLTNRAVLEKAEQARLRVGRVIDIMCRSSRSSLLRTLIGDMPKSPTEATEFLSLADCALRDITAMRRGRTDRLLFYKSVDEARAAAHDVSLKRLLYMHDTVCTTAERIGSNVSVKVALYDMALALT